MQLLRQALRAHHTIDKACNGSVRPSIPVSAGALEDSPACCEWKSASTAPSVDCGRHQLHEKPAVTLEESDCVVLQVDQLHEKSAVTLEESECVVLQVEQPTIQAGVTQVMFVRFEHAAATTNSQASMEHRQAQVHSLPALQCGSSCHRQTSPVSCYFHMRQIIMLAIALLMYCSTWHVPVSATVVLGGCSGCKVLTIWAQIACVVGIDASPTAGLSLLLPPDAHTFTCSCTSVHGCVHSE